VIKEYIALGGDSTRNFNILAPRELRRRTSAHHLGGSNNLLALALLKGSFQSVEMFIEASNDLNSCTEMYIDYATGYAYTEVPPLYFATMMGDNNKIRVLLEKGADPNVSAARALFNVIKNRNREGLQLLLDHGADINNKHDYTPLHGAAINNDIDMYKYLLTLGADPNIRDYKELRPIDYLSIT
jgi:ankyrin repeat protein